MIGWLGSRPAATCTLTASFHPTDFPAVNRACATAATAATAGTAGAQLAKFDHAGPSSAGPLVAASVEAALGVGSTLAALLHQLPSSSTRLQHSLSQPPRDRSHTPSIAPVVILVYRGLFCQRPGVSRCAIGRQSDDTNSIWRCCSNSDRFPPLFPLPCFLVSFSLPPPPPGCSFVSRLRLRRSKVDAGE